MQLKTFEVGDIVKLVGEDELYIVTSIDPIKGLQGYVSLMNKNGKCNEFWCNFVGDVIGHINIDYIFSALERGDLDYD